MVYLMWRLLKPIIKVPIKRIGGLENLPLKGPFVIATNHNSFIDSSILRLILDKHFKNKKLYFISSLFLPLDILGNILFGKVAESIRISQKNKRGVIKRGLKKLKEGNIITIYPEGKYGKKNILLKGKTGVARLALSGKVPVVPVGIIGASSVWSFTKLIPRPKKAVTVNIGKPLYFDKYYGKNNQYSVLTKVTTKIMKEIALLTGKDCNF